MSEASPEELLTQAAQGFQVLETLLDSLDLLGSDVARTWLKKYKRGIARVKELEDFVELVARSGSYGGTSPFIRDRARELLVSGSRRQP